MNKKDIITERDRLLTIPLIQDAVETSNSPEEDDNGWDGLVNYDNSEETNNTSKGKKANKKNSGKSETPMLDAYGVSLNRQAREGKLDPVYGREEELLRIAQILCRKKKNNPILLGDPGVGKTAIIESLAQRIEERRVPVSLMDKNIISLDLASLVAGSMYRGQFEERLKNLLAELKVKRDVILYIDEIHTIMGSGNPEGGLDAANILKPALARGEIRCIGATTLEEYRKTIEKDGAMERRFQKVMVAETDASQTFKILKKIQPNYEKFHHVRYSDEALNACIKLTERYVSDRYFPDKAIDAMDEAGAYTFMRSQAQPKMLNILEQKLKSAEEAKKKAVADLDYEMATRYRDEEHAAKQALDEYIEQLKGGNDTESYTAVDVDAVERVVAMTSGIPLESLTSDDMQSLSGLFGRLSSRVIGQDSVVKDISRTIQRNKIGLRDPKRPIGTFLFLGSSGVGKTHLSKQLAKELFGSEDALIRIDMSEFMERHAISRLIGAPPGYVGYNEGGELTEKVRRNPYSVVLFDEIEKANPEVHNLLLQLLDDGILTDSNGRKVNFKNTILIMTSNVGTRQLKDFGLGIGFRDESDIDLADASDRIIQKSLKKSFSPEFLNRIDRIVTFNTLKDTDIRQIVDLEIKELLDRMESLDITLKLTERALDFIAQKGYDPQYGARPLKRAIITHVEELITQAILDGEISAGNEYVIDIDPDKETQLKVLVPMLSH